MSDQEDYSMDEEEAMDYDDYEDNDDDDGALYDMDGSQSDDSSAYAEQALQQTTVNITCHTTAQLAAKMSQQSHGLTDVLGLPQNAVTTLLQFYRWNTEKLMDAYMENPESVRAKAGVDANESLSNVRTYTDDEEFTCFICCEDKKTSYKLKCEHEFCMDCYSRYVNEKVSLGKVIKCPSCDVALDRADIDAISGKGVGDKLIESSIREYVERHKMYKWCPSPDCKIVVEILNPSEIPNVLAHHKIPVATCEDGHQFCLNCGLENHSPCPCPITKEWVAKCKDDSETAKWIMSNTKQCPKCDTSIEKNGGCNHMTCKKCAYQFCWICMGDWVQHGSSYYQCNRFTNQSDEIKKETENKKSQAELAKKSLARYLFYYNHFTIHETSTKQDAKRCLVVEQTVRSLQEASGISWIEAQFLAESATILLRARRVLKWSYSFAFYCDSTPFLGLFESVQATLSDAVEGLSKLFEIEEPSEIVESRSEFLNKSHFLVDRQQAMLNITDEAINNKTLPADSF